MSSVKLPRPFDAYKGPDPYIFVSYSHKDGKIVYPELTTLKEMGYRIWYDEGIDPGNEWPEEIANAIKQSSVFIVFITPNSVKSQNVINEINFAIDKKIKFLAIHLSETELPDGLQLRIGSLQAILKYNQTNETYTRKISNVLSNTLSDKPQETFSAAKPATAPKETPLPAKASLPKWVYITGGVLLTALVIAGIILSNLPGKTTQPTTPTTIAVRPTSTSRAQVQSTALQPTLTGEPAQAEILPSPTPLSLTWSRINTGQFVNRDSITSVAIDPKDASVIYAGTRFAGLYKTMDSGSSWQPVRGGLTSQQIQFLVIDPNNHLSLYAVTNGGVYQSLDGGSTWQTKNSVLPGQFSGSTSKLIIDSQNSQHLTLAYHSGLYTSDDGGDTWLELYANNCPQMNGSLAMDASTPDTWYVIQTGQDESCKNGFYKTSDAGKTWLLKNEEIFVDSIYNSLQIEKSSDGKEYLYTFSPDKMLIVSSDGGDTWHNTNITQCASLNSDTKGNTIAACSNKLYKFSAGRLQYEIANTAGRNFQVYFAPSDVQKIVLAARNEDQTLNGSNFYISMDTGRNFQERTSGIGMTCSQLKINPFDPGAMYLLSTCGTVGNGFFSTDNGSTWEQYRHFQSVLGIVFHNIAFDTDAKTMYATMYKAKNWLWSTLNRADNWTAKTNPIGNGNATDNFNFETDPLQASTLYFMGNNFKKEPILMTSTDRGISWNTDNAVQLPIEGPIKNSSLYFDPKQGDQMYLIDSGQAIFSSDHGKTWAKCGAIPATGNSQTLMAIDPDDKTHVYLATQGEGIKISTDGCLTWTSSNNGLSYLFVNTLVMDPANPDILHAGTDDGAFVSNDGGKSWRENNEGLLNNPVIYSFAIDPKNNEIFASTPYGLFKLASK